jgi:hypothetical protein
MSDRAVPDVKTTIFGECAIENCDIGADDIDWCSGFWNEMAGEIAPRYVFDKIALHKCCLVLPLCIFIILFSLYPDSPIFSSKEYDWDDPVFLENVFVTPDIEETFAGTNMNGHPVFLENQTNEG